MLLGILGFYLIGVLIAYSIVVYDTATLYDNKTSLDKDDIGVCLVSWLFVVIVGALYLFEFVTEKVMAPINKWGITFVRNLKKEK